MSSLDIPRLLDALGIPVVRRAGEVYWCCCPLPDHTERTPSWFIRERPGDRFHGAWHCYGCKESGWPVQLVQRLRSLETQSEANKWLLTMPEAEVIAPRRVEVVSREVSRALQIPDAVEFEDWPDRYADYLEGRRVTLEQRASWGLGFIPKDSDSELADRIWIPARDQRGTLLSYTARAIKPVRRRYREPFRSEGASSAAVFGELRWPELPRDTVVVVEGAFNALAIERATPRPVAVAALMGSSLDSLQVLKLTRFARVLIATDPDKAGVKAAAELQAALVRYCELALLPIPAGQDCDSMDPDELRALLASRLA